MRATHWGVVGALTLALTLPAQAAEKLRIGVVNLQRAVEESQEGKAAEKELEGLKKKLEDTLNRKLKDFYEREKKLREAWAVLKEGERSKRAQASQQEMEQLQKEYAEAERELMQRKTAVMMKISRKLNTVIEGVAKRDSYDYIFANAAVLWAPRHVDLTNEIIRLYNNAGGK